MVPIRVHRLGGLGNRMFQYMFSARLQELIPDSIVTNVSLPEFGIEIADSAISENPLVLSMSHRVDVLDVAHLVRSGVYDGVSMRAYVQRLEYYSDRPGLARLFSVNQEQPSRSVDPSSLVINVRGAEVLRDMHQDYGPVPVDFFSQIVDETGLEPVIVGQLGEDPYSNEIRRRFNGCKIYDSLSPISDFELLRSAKNVVFGVSTFSWLATWLSPHAEHVFMPVSGIFNPRQRPDIDLLPVDDPRYQFYEFPTEQWSATPKQLGDLLSTGRTFSRLTPTQVRELRREASSRSGAGGTASKETELVILRNQRDRLRRNLARAKEENAALREDFGEHGNLSEAVPSASGAQALLPPADIPPERYEEYRFDLIKRHRSEIRSAEPYLCDLKEWDGDLSTRRVRLAHDDLTVEILGTPSESGRLNVFLSPGGGSVKDAHHAEFDRVDWHPWFGGISVSIDDPTYGAYPGKLQTGWYIGSEEQDAIEAVSLAITRIKRHYSVADHRLYLFGRSAGGTAVLKLAKLFPGAVVVAENAPFYPHRRSSSQQFRDVGIELQDEKFRKRNSVRHILSSPQTRFLVLQNAEDRSIAAQTRSLIEAAGYPAPTVGLSQLGSLTLYLTNVPTRSPSRTYLSVGETRAILSVIECGVRAETTRALFDMVHESLRGRVRSGEGR